MLLPYRCADALCATLGDMNPSLDSIPSLALDPRALDLWRLQTAIWLTLVLLSQSAVLIVSPLSWPIAIAAWFCLAGALAAIAWWVPKLRYAHCRYALDENAFRLVSGVWYRRSVIVPRTRLQYVDLAQGPLERRLSLANLTLHTAGTLMASVAVGGLSLDEAMRIRGELLLSAQRDVV